MKKILAKNYSYINLDRDPELKALYEKLKTRYELTSKIAEKLNQLIAQKENQKNLVNISNLLMKITSLLKK